MALPRSTESLGLGVTQFRLGQVASPFAPDDAGFGAYVTQCLKSWSVDVVLNTGEYLVSCRIVVPQGNEREGVRRMLKFPTQSYDRTYWLGDQVVIGYLEGNGMAPIILGCLYPAQLDPDSTLGLSDLAPSYYVVPTKDTWGDRHDVRSYAPRDTGTATNPVSVVPPVIPTIPAAPKSTAVPSPAKAAHTTYPALPKIPTAALPGFGAIASLTGITGLPVSTTPGAPDADVKALRAYTDRQDSGQVVIEAHSVESADSTCDPSDLADKLLALWVRQSTGAQVLQHDHVVTRGAKDSRLVNHVVRVDDRASTLLHAHTVQATPQLTHSVSWQDVGAALLQLQQQVQVSASVFNTLVFQSTNASEVSLTQTTAVQQTVFSASDSENTTRLTKTDNASGEVGEVSLGVGGVVHLRHVGTNGQSDLVMDVDGEILAQSASGSLARVGKTAITATVGTASLVLDEANGTRLTTPSLDVVAAHTRVGPNGGTSHTIPAGDLLYPKLAKLEARLAALETAMLVHVHPSPAGPTTPTTNAGLTPGGSASFTSPATDMLQALSAD